MTCLKAAAILAALVASTASCRAADNLNGRWAADEAACEGGFLSQPPLVVTHYAVRWQGDTCRIGRMYKAGDAIYIQALCWGADGERSIPVSLHQRSGRLSLTWDRTPRGEFRRCQ
ncbi:MAG TPA: hypothetical protein VGC36_05230 [Rhizomicrobium sp.]